MLALGEFVLVALLGMVLAEDELPLALALGGYCATKDDIGVPNDTNDPDGKDNTETQQEQRKTEEVEKSVSRIGRRTTRRRQIARPPSNQTDGRRKRAIRLQHAEPKRKTGNYPGNHAGLRQRRHGRARDILPG